MKQNLSSKKSPLTGQETEIQKYGTVANRPLSLDHKARLAGAGNLNQILADTMTLRDLYKPPQEEGRRAVVAVNPRDGNRAFLQGKRAVPVEEGVDDPLVLGGVYAAGRAGRSE